MDGNKRLKEEENLIIQKQNTIPKSQDGIKVELLQYLHKRLQMFNQLRSGGERLFNTITLRNSLNKAELICGSSIADVLSNTGKLYDKGIKETLHVIQEVEKINEDNVILGKVPEIFLNIDKKYFNSLKHSTSEANNNDNNVESNKTNEKETIQDAPVIEAEEPIESKTSVVEKPSIVKTDVPQTGETKSFCTEEEMYEFRYEGASSKVPNSVNKEESQSENVGCSSSVSEIKNTKFAENIASHGDNKEALDWFSENLYTEFRKQFPKCADVILDFRKYILLTCGVRAEMDAQFLNKEKNLDINSSINSVTSSDFRLIEENIIAPILRNVELREGIVQPEENIETSESSSSVSKNSVLNSEMQVESEKIIKDIVLPEEDEDDDIEEEEDEDDDDENMEEEQIITKQSVSSLNSALEIKDDDQESNSNTESAVQSRTSNSDLNKIKQDNSILEEILDECKLSSCQSNETASTGADDDMSSIFDDNLKMENVEVNLENFEIWDSKYNDMLREIEQENAMLKIEIQLKALAAENQHRRLTQLRESIDQIKREIKVYNMIIRVKELSELLQKEESS